MLRRFFAQILSPLNVIFHVLMKRQADMEGEGSTITIAHEVRAPATTAAHRAKPPEVSVAIPVYNSAAFLDECLESIRVQTYSGSLEISLYDDMSTDDSYEMLVKWKDVLQARPCTSVVLNRNDGNEGKGAGFARNRAIRQSTGRFICIHDSDDVMEPTRIAKQTVLSRSHPNAIVGCNISRIPEDATARYAAWVNRLSDEQLYTQRFRECTLVHPSWFMARVIYDRVGGYDDGTLLPDDLIFLYKHVALGGELLKVHEPLLKYRWHANMTSHKISRKLLMTYRVRHFEESILEGRGAEWSTFMIWGSGRDGKQFYKTLTAANQLKVSAFVDVAEKKIGTKIILNHATKHSVPVLHWASVAAPFVLCVALDRFGDFEKNLGSLNFIEGKDYFHLV